MDKKEQVQALLDKAKENATFTGWKWEERQSIFSTWQIVVFYKNGMFFSPLLTGMLNKIIDTCGLHSYLQWSSEHQRIEYVIFN